MTVGEAIHWLQTFAEPDAELTVDVYHVGDEWSKNKPIVSLRNEMTRVMSKGDGPSGHTEKRVVLRYE
jgi:hypothetical protein